MIRIYLVKNEVLWPNHFMVISTSNLKAYLRKLNQGIPMGEYQAICQSNHEFDLPENTNATSAVIERCNETGITSLPGKRQWYDVCFLDRVKLVVDAIHASKLKGVRKRW